MSINYGPEECLGDYKSTGKFCNHLIEGKGGDSDSGSGGSNTGGGNTGGGNTGGSNTGGGNTGGGNTGGGNTGGSNTGGGNTGGGNTGGGGGKGKGECKEGENCEGEGSFSGSCVANFQCEGDAIQCAIAQEQHKRNCNMFDEKNDESNLYEQEKNKEGNQTKDLENNKEIDINGKIDTSNVLGGGSCINDLSISVMGRFVTLPISRICPYLTILGNILISISMLVALRIIGTT